MYYFNWNKREIDECTYFIVKNKLRDSWKVKYVTLKIISGVVLLVIQDHFKSFCTFFINIIN